MKLHPISDRFPGLFFLLIGYLSFLIAGFFDRRISPEISFSIFYLIPICLIGWYAGLWEGVISTFASLGISLWLDFLLSGAQLLPTQAILGNKLLKSVILLLIIILLNEIKSLLQKEWRMARTDGLTGIGNNRFFHESAQNQLAEQKKYQHPLTVIYADIDNLKTINNCFGHNTGDAVIQAVARSMLAGARSTDVICRLGGDEFAILIPGMDFEIAKTAVTRIRQRILEQTRRSETPITLSFGMVTYVTPPANVEKMIQIADDLMYFAKNSGKNTIKYILWDCSVATGAINTYMTLDPIPL
jgi:diguanylate cyclase (GGDEF)-like protein